MRRFRFRLESVLRLRSQLERVAKQELAKAMAEVNGFERKLEAADLGLRECADQSARPDAVGGFARALETGLRRHRWRLSRQKRAAEQQLEVVRAGYARRARDKKALQRLRTDAHDAWRREATQREQAELDELATRLRDGRDDGHHDARRGEPWQA
mgnify:CR=1 FL=1